MRFLQFYCKNMLMNVISTQSCSTVLFLNKKYNRNFCKENRKAENTSDDMRNYMSAESQN